MKYSIEPLALRRISCWPNWFQHTVILSLMLLLGFGYWALNPMREQLINLNRQTIKLKQTIAQLTIKTNALPSTAIRYSNNTLNTLQNTLLQSHLLVSLIKPSQTNAFSITAKGDYQQLRLFIFALNQQDIAWRIDSIVIKKRPKDAVDLQLEVSDALAHDPSSQSSPRLKPSTIA